MRSTVGNSPILQSTRNSVLIQKEWILDQAAWNRWCSIEVPTHVLTGLHTVLGELYCPHWSSRRGPTSQSPTTQVLLASYGQRRTYRVVAGCEYCAAQGTETHHQKQLLMLPAAGPLKFLAIDILSSLGKMKSGDEDVDVLTD